ncbi:hypothetical protein E2562_037587 [Oryza meyeriana var. granulata]|uniref:Uncharacterized protein n=1 Tax=Oryza meyeriana var. granulata TaxID=110450 RepID=A0A6G1ETW8_9ORYZ|nr:hypothetical protein E2562_037587 [Oryza meyeriana var. granulata]
MAEKVAAASDVGKIKMEWAYHGVHHRFHHAWRMETCVKEVINDQPSCLQGEKLREGGVEGGGVFKKNKWGNLREFPIWSAT